MAEQPEVTTCTAEVTIDDIQIGEPGMYLSEDQNIRQ